MNRLTDHPLGAPIPATPHAMCSSLPTLEAVIGYEEKDPAVMKKMTQGYPRFVRHTWVGQVAEFLAHKHNLKPQQIVPTCSTQAAQRLAQFMQIQPEVIECEGFAATIIPDDHTYATRAYQFLQHTGYLVSTRQAEDYLIEQGSGIHTVFEEQTFSQNPEAAVIAKLRETCPTASELWLTRSGMTAGYAALKAATHVQAKHHRHVWIQLGWLYLDTQRILEKLLPEGTHCIKVLNVYDTEALEHQLDAIGDKLAGIITEVPTNPLVQTADIESVFASVKKRGGLCIADPTLVSLSNLDTLPWCDIQVVSLTKYAAWSGDVLCGAVMLHPDSTHRDALIEAINQWVEPPYVRELSRLAFQMQSWREKVEQMNQNTLHIARWLESHPSIRTVYWAYDPDSSRHYRKLAGSELKPGSMLTLELNKPCADFYDPAQFAKGPSFGTYFTMMCPFMYLAHYDLVSTNEGRSQLRGHGIDPDLIRLSCGTEPVDQIQAQMERLLYLP